MTVVVWCIVFTCVTVALLPAVRFNMLALKMFIVIAMMIFVWLWIHGCVPLHHVEFINIVW